MQLDQGETADRRLVELLAARGDVERVDSNRPVRWIEDPVVASLPVASDSPDVAELGVQNVNAPAVFHINNTLANFSGRGPSCAGLTVTPGLAVFSRRRFRTTFGYGRVDVLAAVNAVPSTTPTADPDANEDSEQHSDTDESSAGDQLLHGFSLPHYRHAQPDSSVVGPNRCFTRSGCPREPDVFLEEPDRAPGEARMLGGVSSRFETRQASLALLKDAAPNVAA